MGQVVSAGFQDQAGPRRTAYLVIRKCQLHVVVVSMIEHLDGIVAQVRDAVGPHRPRVVKPCEEQQCDAEGRR